MNQPQIAHESQTQRQHARVRIPATALINGKRFPLNDLSASGMAIANFPLPLKKHQPVPVRLEFNLEGFSFSLDVQAMVTHHDSARKILGCAFDNLARDQIGALNAIIKSYLSGILIAQADLLNIVARDNFTLTRKTAHPSPRGTYLKKTIMITIMIVAGFSALFFLTSNLYEKISLIKSYDASVRGETSIETLLPSRDAHRLHLQSRANVRITGDQTPRNGIIENVQTQPDNPALTIVTVRLQNAVPPELAGRPAYVEFFLH